MFVNFQGLEQYKIYFHELQTQNAVTYYL